MSLIEQLTQAGRERFWPNVVPRDAATLILIDRSGPKPKVLLGRRHAGHRFMPGKFVFPGGRIEPADKRMSVAGALDAQVEARLLTRMRRPAPLRARALALAAIRETYEETGLMLGTKEHGAPDAAPEGSWAAFAAAGVFPALEPLHFVARAITPPRRPKRFDTRFFAAEASAIAHRVADVVGPDSELVELVWVPLAQAEDLEIPAITAVVLKELAARLDAGMAHHLAVPFYFEIKGRFRREEL
jgi:8-oxo-dGTP pyrophosphatase MutT (NUDIX family)